MGHDSDFERGNHQYLYKAMEPVKWSRTHCSGEVRWFEGALQQRFVITEGVGCSSGIEREDWRFVPTFDTASHSKGAM